MQDNVSWAIGLLVLASMLAIALVVFLLGTKRYTKENPKGSPITSIVRVFVAAARKWRVKDTRGPDNYWYGYDHDSFHHSRSTPISRSLAHTKQYR